jgi:hypothetical protein
LPNVGAVDTESAIDYCLLLFERIAREQGANKGAIIHEGNPIDIP